MEKKITDSKPQKSALEIVEETISYYSEDPSRRAVTVSACSYLLPDGRMCAVGRCLVDPQEKWWGSCDQMYYLDDDVKKVEIQPVFKPEYEGHDIQLWKNLQNLHDDDYNWNKQGLTEAGQKEAERLREAYKDQ